MHPPIHSWIGMRFEAVAIGTLFVGEFVQVVFEKIMYALLIGWGMDCGGIEDAIDIILVQQVADSPPHRACR